MRAPLTSESTLAGPIGAARLWRSVADPANRTRLLGSICAVGILLRFLTLVGQRTLWLDEAHLATAIAGLDWQQLLRPLANDQVAPFGFLVAAKFFSAFLPIEVGLRLPSFIAGVGAVLMAWAVAEQRRLSTTAAVTFLIMVALFKPFVYYSFEFKQYEIEFFWGLATLFCFEHFRRKPDLSSASLLWLCGLLCVASAMPAPFILLFPGLYVIATFVRTAKMRSAVLVGAAYGSWAVLYLTLVHLATPTHVVSSMSVFWADAMLPAGGLPAKVNWLLGSIFDPFEAAGFSSAAPIAAFIAIVGFASSVRRDAAGTWVLVIPLALAFVAALFDQYPFDGRLLLFAMPGVLLLVVEGLAALSVNKLIPAVARGAVVFLVMIFGLLSTASSAASRTPFLNDTLPYAIDYIRSVYSPGETVYIESYARPVFKVYHDRLGVPSDRIVLGHDPRSAFGADLSGEFSNDKLDNFAWFMRDLEQMAHKKSVWFLFANIGTPHGAFSKTLTLYVCGTYGTIVKEYQVGESAAYLCSFNATAKDIHLTPATMGPYAPIHQSYRLP